VIVCSLFDVVVKLLLFGAELFDDGELECYVEGSIRGQNQRRYAHFPAETEEYHEKQDSFVPAEI
jgi:hypothetical protein